MLGKRRYIGGFLLVFLVIRGCQVVSYESDIGLCRDTALLSKKSPNGFFIATIIERNCGATTGYVYFACLRPVFWGRLFGDGVKVVSGETSLNDMYWLGDNRLVIEKDSYYNTLSVIDSAFGIAISVK